MISKIYSYIFYRVYSWAANRNVVYGTPADMIALGVITWVSIFNLLTLTSILQIITGKEIDPFFNFSKLNLFLFLTAIIFLVDMFLLKKDMFKKLKKRFEGESAQEKKKGSILVLCYIFGSLVIFLLFTYLAKCAYDSSFSIFNYFHSLLL